MSARPVASPVPSSAEWFAAIDREEFTLPLCGACDTTFLYPRLCCPSCGSRDVRLVPASGRGTVASFVVNHRPPPGFEADGPYVIALVDLAEGPRMMGGVLGIDPSELEVDQPVRVVFEERGDRRVVQFEVCAPGAEEGVA